MRCLPTPRAVEVLGRSKLTLLRYARDGHLTPGVHFFRGPYQNSPITLDVERCQQRFAELARMPTSLSCQASASSGSCTSEGARQAMHGEGVRRLS